MNFLKKMLGLEKGLEERMKEFKTRGTLFEVVKQTRNLKYSSSKVDSLIVLSHL